MRARHYATVSRNYGGASCGEVTRLSKWSNHDTRPKSRADGDEITRAGIWWVMELICIISDATRTIRVAIVCRRQQHVIPALHMVQRRTLS
jgi:hypothetical protein